MFGNLGEMAGLMKKFSEIQKNMKQMKEDLSRTEITGNDPEGHVEIRMSGDLNVRQIRIDPALVSANNPALVEAACSAALQNVLIQFKEVSAKKLSDATGGLNIPGLT
ncbi:MAG: Nucleoid-associated protein [Lentisphaerae bacterium ADurb.Bin242]|nr:MAG: Nucleoid-associated protein [Lentisphaerae bacterium ADurb.Bin242]